MGLRVFPVRKRDKRPAITGWKESATSDLETIRDWWGGRHANYNIGIATGKASGVFVLDVDVGDGKEGMESLSALEKEIGLIPRDRVVRTGSGGLHIYLKYPDDGKSLKNSAGTLMKGLDIRSDGGLVVAPPSIHPCGQRYEWVHTAGAGAGVDEVMETLDDFPECPALADYIRSSGRKKGVSAKSGGIVGLSEIGVRNDTLFHDRTVMLRGMGYSHEQTLDLIRVINTEECKPPLPDSDVEALVASAYSWKAQLPQDDNSYARDIAQRLAERFRSVGGEWYSWDGQRWMSATNAAWIEASRGVMEGHAATARKELDEGEKLARSLLSARKIRDLTSMASTDAALQAAPIDLDADPNLLNLNNGILKLDRLELVPHDPALMLTKLAPVEYDLQAKCPTFDRFLHEVQPDAEIRAFLARLFGYALLGDPAEHRFFILHGPGRNGKSVLMDAIMHVLGSYARTADPSTFIARRGDVGGPRGDLVRLKDARLVYTSELGTGQIFDAPLIKRITGGENITASRKHKDEVEFRPVFVPFMTTNALPVIDGGDRALARRLVAVPFAHVVAEKDQDTRLGSKLRAEAAGILGWMLEGLRDYRARGLAVPDDIDAHTKEWIGDTDLVQQFLDDCYERDPNGRVAPLTLQNEYRFWCSQRGYAALSERVLREALERKGIKRKKSGGNRSYVGIRELPPALRLVA